MLRDGASSQYGSDAIAGVINIILKKDVDSNGASITYGQYVDNPGHDDGYGENGTVTAAQGFDLPNGGSVSLQPGLQ